MNRDVKLILVVEDDENDVFLLKRAVQQIGYRGEVRVCSHAAEAIDYLACQGSYADRAAHATPQMVITDLKMPGLSGFDLLKWIKDNPWAMVIPIVVLSSSNNAADVKEAYCLGANAYMMKPATSARLEKMLEHMFEFWADCEKPEANADSPCAAGA